jgi:hypothetical protein
MSHANTLRIWVRGHYRLGGYGSQTPPVNRQEAIRAFDALVAENQQLRERPPALEQAVGKIHRLEGEIQQLRDALALIANPDYTHLVQLKSVARAALSGTPSDKRGATGGSRLPAEEGRLNPPTVAPPTLAGTPSEDT